MKKLMLSALAATALSMGAAVAHADAESQAGSAWRQQPDFGPAPGTPEYYGNSGGPVELRRYPYGYAYGPQAVPAYPYEPPERARRRDRDWDDARNARGRDRDRDGDGIRNRRDRYPDDPRRW